MDFFRPDDKEFNFLSPKVLLFFFVATLIIGSFLVQISMGICPVPP